MVVKEHGNSHGPSEVGLSSLGTEEALTSCTSSQTSLLTGAQEPETQLGDEQGHRAQQLPQCLLAEVSLLSKGHSD